jgi:Na+/melibiose symporter-like transporter
MTNTNPGPSGKKEPDHEPSGNEEPSEQLVWEEYQYRHDLCWRLIFQTTIAAILIYVVPYVERDVAAELQYFMLALPVIAIALVLFALRRFLSEEEHLERVRQKHWSTRKRDHSSFRRDAKWFLIALMALGVVNIAAICIVWVPRLH